MADRSVASSGAAGLTDFSRAIKRIGMLVGVVRSATVPGTNENPLIAPPVLRLTSAVTCCHKGFAVGLISSPHFRWAWGRGAGPDSVTRARARPLAWSR